MICPTSDFVAVGRRDCTCAPSKSVRRDVGWVERSETHRGRAGDDGYRFAPPILRTTTVLLRSSGLRLRRPLRAVGLAKATTINLRIAAASICICVVYLRTIERRCRAP